jgi:hypothetical protein
MFLKTKLHLLNSPLAIKDNKEVEYNHFGILVFHQWQRLVLYQIYDNKYPSIIDIYFYETFSTFNPRALAL